MNLIVLTPEKEIYNGPITSVKVPGSTGQFEILKGHASIVSSLVEGEIRVIKEGGDNMRFTIEKGFVEVLMGEVALLVQGVKE